VTAVAPCVTSRHTAEFTWGERLSASPVLLPLGATEPVRLEETLEMVTSLHEPHAAAAALNPVPMGRRWFARTHRFAFPKSVVPCRMANRRVVKVGEDL